MKRNHQRKANLQASRTWATRGKGLEQSPIAFILLALRHLALTLSAFTSFPRVLCSALWAFCLAFGFIFPFCTDVFAREQFWVDHSFKSVPFILNWQISVNIIFSRALWVLSTYKSVWYSHPSLFFCWVCQWTVQFNIWTWDLWNTPNLLELVLKLLMIKGFSKSVLQPNVYLAKIPKNKSYVIFCFSVFRKLLSPSYSQLTFPG